MKVRSAVTLTACAALVVGMVAAAPAQAYDKKSYGYAARHMIDRKDIPAALGAFKKSMAFNATNAIVPLDLCSIPGTGSVPDTSVSVPKGKLHFEANYSAKGVEPQALWIGVEQYTSASKAIDAFNKAKTEVKKCTGSVTNSWTDPENGAVTTYTVAIENGVVPSVTTVGVESLFVNTNSDSTATSQEAPWHSDDYTVFSLVNNVIIATHYSTNATVNISNDQRKAVNQVAFNAIGAWVD